MRPCWRPTSGDKALNALQLTVVYVKVNLVPYVINDIESNNLTLTETVNVAQSRPFWRLLLASGTTQSYWRRPEIMMMTILDPGLKAVSLPVINVAIGCQPRSIAILWPVPNYTAW